MIDLRIEPGENPASAQDIRLMAGNERVGNARILKAFNDDGKKTVVCEIVQEKESGHKNDKPEAVRSEGRKKSGKIGE